MKHYLAVLVALFFVVQFRAGAETFRLRDGRTIEGEVIRRTTGAITIKNAQGIATYQLYDLDDASARPFLGPTAIGSAPATPTAPTGPVEAFVTKKGQRIEGVLVTQEPDGIVVRTATGNRVIPTGELDDATRQRLAGPEEAAVATPAPPAKAGWQQSLREHYQATRVRGGIRSTIQMVLALLGIVIAAFAHLWLVMRAFANHFVWGLAVLCTGVGTLLFVLIEWNEAVDPLKYYVIGVALILGAAFLG